MDSGGKTYDRTEQSEEALLRPLELLLGVGLEIERGLVRLLVRGRVEFNLVLGHNLPHHFTEGRGLAILAGGGEIDRREDEGVRDDGLLRGRGLDARTSIGTPGRGGGLVTELDGGQRREGLLGVGVDGTTGRGSARLNRSVVDQTGERVGGAFEFVPPLPS